MSVQTHVSLSVPLSGSRLIEASAGTGKTHTLVLLLLRAIVVEGCDPGELVAVTFTRAAAGELRERTRAALAAAARRAAQPQADIPVHLGEAVDALIAMALARDEDLTRAMLARRLRAAQLGIDSLWLGTLHGFCQRLLSEFGPVLGVPGIEDQVDDGNALFSMACADAWRALQADRSVTPAMAERFPTPDAIAGLLRGIIDLSSDALMPAVAPDALALEMSSARYLAAWDFARSAASDFPALASLIADRATYRMSTAKDKLSDAALAEIADALAGYFAQSAGGGKVPEPVTRLSTACLRTFQHEALRKKGAALPDHPLSKALDALLDAERLWHDDLNVALVHRLHGDTKARLSRLGFEQGRTRYDELVARVAALLQDDGKAGRLIALVRSRWRLALIDEFQDTDAVQHAIFAALFGDRLMMVGDPKQAIYRFRGGDVHAYRRAALDADSIDRLDVSHRAEASVIDAVNALFDPARVPEIFGEVFIVYAPVRSAYDPARGSLSIAGEPVSAGLHLWTVRPADGGVWSSRTAAGDQVVADVAGFIVELLDDSSSARIDTPGQEARRLRPSDVAVLCLTNSECALVARALRARGIPVSLGVDPDVEASAADDILRLLAAWLAPNDSARLRALALSGFYGQVLADLPDANADSPLTPRQLSAFAEQARLAASGETARALTMAIRAGASTVRRAPNGQARVDAWLELADRLIAWNGPGRGLNELDIELRRWLVHKDDGGRGNRRADTADAVQVMTVHASKGLEFGIVFAPFLWAQSDPAARRRRQGSPVVRFHDGTGRLRADIGSPDFEANVAHADEEEAAEAMRKAYVAITRARHRLYVPVVVTKGGWVGSALARLLPGVDASTSNGLDAAMHALVDHARGAVAIVDAPGGVARLERSATPVVGRTPVARSPVVPIDDYRLLSYSRLVRGLIDIPRDHDQAVPAENARLQAGEEIAWQPRGAAFGSCFHTLMERIDPAAPDAVLMARIANSHGFGGARELAYLKRLVVVTLRSTLPGGVALERLAGRDRTIEMEFFFPLRGFSATVFGQVLDGHDRYRRPAERWPAALAAIHGYMRGFIDLVYRVDGRYFVLDYKTNDLGIDVDAYRAAGLASAIRGHDYDLQYLIYLVALQRLLRSRLGGAYDYERCIGGSVYLFVRGLEHGEGIHHDRPPRSLVDAIEDVLCGGCP
jgi:exodeoxyribonuclease V beta subunit